MYVTPDRFRTMRTGTDLSDVEEWELRSILEAASRTADAFCSVPTLPQRFDFRGGTVTDEEREWIDGARRIFFTARPVKALLSFKALASNTVFLTVNPDQIFVNHLAGWAEIVATQYSLAGSAFPMTPFWGLTNPIIRYSYTYGYGIAEVGDMLDPTDALTYRAVHQFWDIDEDLAVYVNGTLADPDDYTLDANEGIVVFNDPLALGAIVTADYTHKLPFEIAQATALIAADIFNEGDLVSKGMGSLGEIQVEEITLRRSVRGRAQAIAPAVPETAAALLAGYQFLTVR